MGNEISSVSVNGRKVYFQGNFGFKINNQEYSTSGGKVYNSQGKSMKELNMPKYIAEHFFAMSEMSTNDKQEYTFTKNDIDYAEELQGVKANSSTTAIVTRLRTLTGSQGKVITDSKEKIPGVNNGVFTSQYKSVETSKVSTISVWMNE